MIYLYFTIMLEIFAKFNTDEKVAVQCVPSQRDQMIKRLKEEFGGEWICVDEVFTGGEILKFNDGLIYKGSETNEKKRYSSAIVKFLLNML
jgi:hypothetical protein